MRSAIFNMIFPFAWASVYLQTVLKAFLAAATALSTSSFEAATAWAKTYSVAGLITSKGLPPLEETSSPLMKSFPATAASF
jgi:hypothetical protein